MPNVNFDISFLAIGVCRQFRELQARHFNQGRLLNHDQLAILIGQVREDPHKCMALPHGSTVPNDDSAAAKVVSYILFNWLTRHMEFNCHADAQGPKPLFLCQVLPPPLHFKSVELIQNRHYSLELQKEPFVYLMKELTVSWLPHLDAQLPPEFFPTVLTNKNVDHPSGFYRVISEVSEDYEYLVRLQISRI